MSNRAMQGVYVLKRFYPNDYVEDAFVIDYQALYDAGYRGVILDIDNTLVPHGADSTPEVDDLFRRIQDIGLKTIIVSNNDAPRIERFLQNIDCPYVCDAEKPRKQGYLKALEVLGLPKNQVICVGDQVFTDVLGANACGIDSILVKYIGYYDDEPKGKRRNLESVIVGRYEKRVARERNCDQGGGREDGQDDGGQKNASRTSQVRRFLNREIPFSGINPTCYAIAERKEIVRRHVKDVVRRKSFATTHSEEALPFVVSSHSCGLIKRGPGIDPELQYNKATNIELASAAIDGLVIHPGETFSFWRTVGNTTVRRGYKDGRIIVDGKLAPGVGGGLCNLGNTVNLLILHSPLEVTEFHTHSDALAPDGPVRVPLATGTSVSYNYIDFRFKNTTDQDFQIKLWCADEKSFGELRSERPVPFTYELVEEGHRFQKEGDTYFRVSKIYRETRDAETGYLVEKKLILDNHSEVMFDYSLIPPDQISNSND